MPKLSIYYSIFLIYEIVNEFQNIKGKKAWVAFELDMEKTYDGEEWPFLFGAPQLSLKNSLPQSLTLSLSTMMYLISLSLIEVSTKGSLWYYICMEVLTRALRHAQNAGKANIGIKIILKA